MSKIKSIKFRILATSWKKDETEKNWQMMNYAGIKKLER